MPYEFCGKQVLLDGKDFAQAKDIEGAELITKALNDWDHAHSPIMPELRPILKIVECSICGGWNGVHYQTCSEFKIAMGPKCEPKWKPGDPDDCPSCKGWRYHFVGCDLKL